MNPKTEQYPWTSADIDVAKLKKTASILGFRGIAYGFGSKPTSLTTVPEKVNFTKRNSVDCSGFVRYALAQCGLQIPDGSVNQREWFRKSGFKPTKQFDETDGRVRVAFLKPGDTPSGIGHVVLVIDGVTYESHGGRGVDSRPWGSASWMRKCSGFVIDPRGAA